jgi:hypothetical protein
LPIQGLKNLKPVYPETSIRRLCGMSMFGKGVAINSRSHVHHVRPALTLASGDRFPGGIFIGFLPSEHPIGCLGQMPSDGSNSDRMPFPLSYAFKEDRDVLVPPVGIAAHHRVVVLLMSNHPFDVCPTHPNPSSSNFSRVGALAIHLPPLGCHFSPTIDSFRPTHLMMYAALPKKNSIVY